MSCHTELAELEGTRDAIVVADEDAVAEIHAVRAQLARYTEDVRTVVNHPSYALPFLQPGRLVRVRRRDVFPWRPPRTGILTDPGGWRMPRSAMASMTLAGAASSTLAKSCPPRRRFVARARNIT